MEVAGRRARWDRSGMRIQFIERVRLFVPRMNGNSEAVKDGFHLVRHLDVGRVANSILQKPTSEDGVSEKRRFALVLRVGRVVFHVTDAFAGRVIRQRRLVWRRGE